MKKQYFYFAITLIVTVTFSVAMKEPMYRFDEKQDHSKLLKFSHSFHVKSQGVACTDCHDLESSSTISSGSLLPTHEQCQTCHEEKITNDCAFCHSDADNIVPIEIPERELMFSHEKHIAKNVKCETCHAGVEDVEYAASAMPSMETCMNCHSENRIAMNCETCHTNFYSLIPENHLEGDFKKTHKELTRIGMADVSCSTCHTESFCQDCHTGIELQGFKSSGNLMAEPSPRTSAKDSPMQLRLQQVHALNYRFTHGIDAKSKALDCATCNEQQSFCSECHQAGGNVTQQRFKPASHSIAGFTTLGKGSGGGVHAELAKRDLELCASCHETDGEDPTCATCHF
ncbi:MAG: cytochrome c3 family protein [Ignavibacteriae bacterium]|nr:cytochrome c3 family protein [Ignavibacteriota bacterium]